MLHSEALYFYQNAEGTALAPFDCWLVLRGIKTMALRVGSCDSYELNVDRYIHTYIHTYIHCQVERQQENALKIALWLQESCPKAFVRSVLYAGLSSHLDYDMHMAQATGALAKADTFCYNVHRNLYILHHIYTYSEYNKWRYVHMYIHIYLLYSLKLAWRKLSCWRGEILFC